MSHGNGDVNLEDAPSESRWPIWLVLIIVLIIMVAVVGVGSYLAIEVGLNKKVSTGWGWGVFAGLIVLLVAYIIAIIVIFVVLNKIISWMKTKFTALAARREGIELTNLQPCQAEINALQGCFRDNPSQWRVIRERTNDALNAVSP